VVFDVPGATITSPTGINDAGTISGYYQDSGSTYHGFVRAADGTITRINIPGAGIEGTVASAINANEAIVGWFGDANDAAHGFERDSAGGNDFRSAERRNG
jgi:hypothetical protein